MIPVCTVKENLAKLVSVNAEMKRFAPHLLFLILLIAVIVPERFLVWVRCPAIIHRNKILKNFPIQ